jgi:hypothetical protein
MSPQQVGSRETKLYAIPICPEPFLLVFSFLSRRVELGNWDFYVSTSHSPEAGEDAVLSILNPRLGCVHSTIKMWQMSCLIGGY